MDDRKETKIVDNVKKRYRVRNICINSKHKLYGYCSKITLLTNALYNAVCFRQKQVITAVKKPQDERFVLEEIRSVVALLDSEKYQMVNETHYILSYQFLEKIFSLTKNPDYFAGGLPRQTAQQVIRQCVDDFNSFFRSSKAHRQDPSKFRGIPQPPGYHEKDGHSLATFTNQQIIPHRGNTGSCEMKIPLSKIRVSVGKIEDSAILKSASIIINSDLNASANILKAAFPDAFQKGCNPDFTQVVVITHPDFILAQELKERQKKLYQMSKSKKKRLQQKNQK